MLLLHALFYSARYGSFNHRTTEKGSRRRRGDYATPLIMYSHFILHASVCACACAIQTRAGSYIENGSLFTLETYPAMYAFI